MTYAVHKYDWSQGAAKVQVAECATINEAFAYVECNERTFCDDALAAAEGHICPECDHDLRREIRITFLTNATLHPEEGPGIMRNVNDSDATYRCPNCMKPIEPNDWTASLWKEEATTP